MVQRIFEKNPPKFTTFTETARKSARKVASRLELLQSPGHVVSGFTAVAGQRDNVSELDIPHCPHVGGFGFGEVFFASISAIFFHLFSLSLSHCFSFEFTPKKPGLQLMPTSHNMQQRHSMQCSSSSEANLEAIPEPLTKASGGCGFINQRDLQRLTEHLGTRTEKFKAATSVQVRIFGASYLADTLGPSNCNRKETRFCNLAVFLARHVDV